MEVERKLVETIADLAITHAKNDNTIERRLLMLETVVNALAESINNLSDKLDTVLEKRVELL